MKVAGIYPQKLSIDPKIQHAVSDPYGLEKILAVAEARGHDVDLFLPLVEEDGAVRETSEENLIERIVDFDPDVAAFSMYTCQFSMGERIAAEVKKRKPSVLTVGGNRYPTFLKEEITEPFDVFVVKEGEETFSEILEAMESRRDFSHVKGLVYKQGGVPGYTGDRPRIKNLDAWPDALRFPVITSQVYRGISIPPLSTEPSYAVSEYGRGCVYACTFCDSKDFLGSQLTFRDPSRVADEMFQLQELGVDIVYFMDLNFTMSQKHALELCETFIDRGVDMSWYAMSNLGTLDGKHELMHALKEAGCFKIAYGVESTNNETLVQVGKKVGKNQTDHDQQTRVLQESFEAGLLNQGYYIIGFPNETVDSIREDASKIQDLPLHILNVGIYTPIPLTQLRNDVVSQGLALEPDLEKHDRNQLVFDHPHLSNEQLKGLQKEMHGEFYDSLAYRQRIDATCRKDARFVQAFNEYFEFLGKEQRIVL